MPAIGASTTGVSTSLTLGSLTVETPVVLAPMAGITNAAYRRLCAEQGAGLYVCEMITSRGLVERDETTLKMLVFDDLERIRSVQLYGTDRTSSSSSKTSIDIVTASRSTTPREVIISQTYRPAPCSRHSRR